LFALFISNASFLVIASNTPSPFRYFLLGAISEHWYKFFPGDAVAYTRLRKKPGGRMRFVCFAVACLLVQSLFAQNNQTLKRRCHTADIQSFDHILVETQLRSLRARRNFESMNLRSEGIIEIPVYFHSISKNQKAKDGYIDEKQVHDQMDELNRAYAPMNIQFVLLGFDRTVNAKWFEANYGEDDQMKKNLHQGDAATLNIYTSAPTDGALGWATFPWEVKKSPRIDGVVIHFGSLPGGHLKEFNMGRTLVHEVGHWLGLFHTFQGGCVGGDMVDDTAPEGGPNFGCPKEIPDTCKEHEGLDPINNYMDYSDDVCLTDFSYNQAERIRDTFKSYREI
jgi:hypothetical protein